MISSEKAIAETIGPLQLPIRSEHSAVTKLGPIVLLVTWSPSSGTSDVWKDLLTGNISQARVVGESSMFSHLPETSLWEEDVLAPRAFLLGGVTERLFAVFSTSVKQLCDDWVTELSTDPDIRAQTSSLSFPARDRHVRRELANIISVAEEEVFEDGVQGEFARQLALFVEKYRSLGLAVLESYLLSESASLSIVGEVLRQLGLLSEPSTCDMRLRILTRSLTHRSAIIRDAAGLGLGFLGDKGAIPHVEAAIRREHSQACRASLEQVLEDLKSTADAASAA